MRKQDLQNRIIDLFSRFVTLIKGHKAMGNTDINRIAEDVLIPVFKEVYGYQNLKNLNHDKNNYPAIDLGDETAKISIQVTATSGIEKIKETLGGFIKNEYYLTYERVQVYILTEKEEYKYSEKTFRDITNVKIQFDKNQDILDYRDLLEKISKFKVEKLQRICDILETNFGNGQESSKREQTTSNPPAGIPSNLHHSGVAELVGRDQTLKDLHALFQNNDLIVITGMRGVGKTELAIRYALKYQVEYPGGLCWIDIEKANPDEIGKKIVKYAHTKLGFCPDPKLEDLHDQVQQCFRNWCAGRVLLLFDNVNDYTQVKQWIPPAPSQFKALITTHKQNLAQSIQRLDLYVLELEDALKLLELWAGLDRMREAGEEASALCQWLGRLPLGIELVGRYLKRKPDVSVQEILKRLKKKRLEQTAIAIQKTPDDMTAKLGVSAAFELSWQEISNLAQELGCFLSIFTLAPISWSIIQRCHPKHDPEELEDSRDDELLNFHLILRKDRGMYSLHELIREFFRSKLVSQIHTGNLPQFIIKKLSEIASQDFQCIFEVINQGLLDCDFPETNNFLPSALELGEQLYIAKASCVKGIGVLAEYIFSLRKDSKLPQLGIRLDSTYDHSRNIYLHTGWYFGDEVIPDIVELSQEVEKLVSDDDEERFKSLEKLFEVGWNHFKSTQIKYQPSWPWHWIHEDLSNALLKLLNQRILPVEAGALSLEAAWHGLLLLTRGNPPHCYYNPSYHPYSLNDIESCLSEAQKSTFLLGIQHCLNQLEIEIECARSREQDSIGFPDFFLNFKYCTGFTDEILLNYASYIFEGAVRGYEQIINSIFTKISSNLKLASFLPATMVAVVIPPRYNSGMITVGWYWEPLNSGNSSTVDIRISDLMISQNDARYKVALENFSSRYSKPLKYLEIKSISYERLTHEWFGNNPITEIAYKWLWEDFKKIGWVKDNLIYPHFPCW
jgi:hypothetical protein